MGRKIYEFNKYYSVFFILKIQLTQDYEYNKRIDLRDAGSSIKYKVFLPASNLKFWFGVLWRSMLTFYVAISSAKFRTSFSRKNIHNKTLKNLA